VENLEPLHTLLMQRLPPLIGTDVNDRTVWVWRRHWIDKLTVREIAVERGWCAPAVEFHLRRGARALRS